MRTANIEDVGTFVHFMMRDVTESVSVSKSFVV